MSIYGLYAQPVALIDSRSPQILCSVAVLTASAQSDDNKLKKYNYLNITY